MAGPRRKSITIWRLSWTSICLISQNLQSQEKSIGRSWQLRINKIGPLSKLSEYDFEAFVSGLEFKGGGVAHGTYKPLMSTCTISEIFEVFGLFGMHRDYVVRILEAKCVLPPPNMSGIDNCEFEFWSFCSSMCGIVVFPPFPSTTE